MNRVVHFEIGASDVDRAIGFYQKVFGWKIEKWQGPMDYWMIKTGEKGEMGIDGGMYKREMEIESSSDFSHATNYICTIGIEDIDECISIIEDNGGEITDPKRELQMVGWLAYARDTEGNIFGIMQGTGEMAM